MSFQEYAQLGSRNTQRDQDTGRTPPRSRAERPYTGSLASFSVPRQSTSHSNTSSSSSTTISPSNSASQKFGSISPSSQLSDPLDSIRQLKQLELGTGKKPDLIDVPLPWRPFYLQRKILGCFAVAFIALAIALEALLAFAKEHQGLVTTGEPGYYVWRLAPPGILILVAALWGRVEYQAMHSAPWLRLSKGPTDARRTLLLDYLTMAQPKVVWRAIKNQDYVVAATTIITMFLQVSVLASAGLMFILFVDVPSQTAPATLQTAFVNNASALASAGSLPFYTMLGLQQEDLLFPDGVSAGWAYQEFLASASTSSDVTATVDGLSAGLECEAARLNLSGAQMGQGSQLFNTTFTAGGCTVAMPLTSAASFSRPAGVATNQSLYFARFGEGRCLNLAEDRRIVIVFGTETLNTRPLPTNSSTTNISVNGTIPRSAALLCTPTYGVSRVDVTKRNGVVIAVDPTLDNQPRALSNIEAWGIADAFFGSFRNELADSYADTTPWFYQPGVVNADRIMHMVLDLRYRTTGVAISPDALLDTGILEDVVNDYFKLYIPLLASRSLMQPSSIPTTAIVTGQSERLTVSAIVAHSIVIHLAIAAVLAAACIWLVPGKGFLPRNPGSIIDQAVLIANSRDVLQTLRGTGGADAKTVEERLTGSEFYAAVEAYERADSKGSGYFRIFGGQNVHGAHSSYAESVDVFPHPLLLHPIFRMAAFVAVVALIIGLEFGSQVSNKAGGFDDVTDEETRHVLWTVFPASILCIVAFYFIVSGFFVRLYAPYFALVNGAAFEKSISLNLVDKAPLVVLFEALRYGNLAVVATTSAALIACLLPIFASTLFTVATVPTTAGCRVVPRDFFSLNNSVSGDGFCATCQNGTVLASLVLNGNISYPGFTYEDLAFPAVALTDVPKEMRGLPDDIVVAMTIPAARPNLVCRSFSQSELVVNVSVSAVAGTGNPMTVVIPAVAGGTTVEDNTVIVETGFTLSDVNDPSSLSLDPNAFFGRGVYRPVTSANGTTISRWIWVWGQLSNAGSPQAAVKTISALTCNETITQVNVAVRFLGSTLDIYHTNPPIPDEATVTPIPLAIDGTLNYDDLITLPTPHLLDPFFQSLTASRFAIPLPSLGDPSSNLTSAITLQHALIRTQIINTFNRRPLPENTTNTSLPANLIAPTLPSGAARRIIQDTLTTRILQALLAFVLVASLTSWLALPKTNILPQSPSTIAAVVSLLTDGNIFGLLGRGAEWAGEEQLKGYFKDGEFVTRGFGMGWEVKGGRGGREREREVFAVRAFRTGGWGGGENVGLGLQARVGMGQREFVRDWGWRT